MSDDARSGRVPLADLTSDLWGIRPHIALAVQRVIDSGIYIGGPEVADFERTMAVRLGVESVVGVACGTDALVLALLAAGVQSGDEVITVSHTAGPTVAAIRMIGAIPVLVDVEVDAYCLDPDQLECAYSPRTKALIAVHLYGHPADMDRIVEFGRRRSIAIIEDCAQAQEAMIGERAVGSIGHFGCFSFYPTKNLGAIGDAGLVSVRDPGAGERIRQLRAYGWTQPQFATLPNGRCSRLDPLQAAILSVKIPHLSDQISRRRELAHLYNEALSGLPLVLPAELPGYRHVYHLYVIRSDRRDELMAHLDSRGIASGVHYPFPVHLQPGLADGARIPGALVNTETIASEILTLPLFPSISESQQARVIAAIRSFFQ